MSILLDGTGGVTTPGVVNTAGETIATNLTFTGTGNRITGDFSNATHANRVAFQTSTANTATYVGIITNGTGARTDLTLYNGSDPTNASFLASQMRGGSSLAVIESGITGTGTYLPMTFHTGGSERARIDTSGNLLFNSGYGSAATAYGCRAWVNFNGTGTVAIRASGNVSSITDLGTGNYRVVFTTAMVDASYSITFGSSAEVNYGGVISIDTGTSYNSSGANIYTMTNAGSTPADFISNSVVFFR